MTVIEGLVQHVETEAAQSFATADAAISDTVVYVADVVPFLTESGTCTVDIDGVEYTATPDVDTSSLTVDPALSVAVETTDPIILVPAAEIKWAFVVFPTDDPGDWLRCRVPHELVGYVTLADGPRELDAREAVLVETEPVPLIVTILNQPAMIDGATIDPDSTIPPTALTDGEPPASSPTPTLEQFAVGGLKWSVSPVANADPVKFRVYADTVDPPTVDAAHLVADTAATEGSFASIDGVALLPSDPSVAPDPVFVACIEYDADGDAALSATSASAVPRRATASDISADYVYAGMLQANQIEAGTFEADLALIGRLSVGNYTLIDGDTGAITIYADPEHTEPLIQLDPAGSVFRGQIIADDISVIKGLFLQGTDSHVAQNAGITLDNAINDPGVAPSLTLTPATLAWPAVASGYTNRGICWDGTNWLRLRAHPTGVTKVETINTSGVVTSTVTLSTPDPIGFANSVVKVGSYWFIASLWEFDWAVRKFNTSGGQVDIDFFVYSDSDDVSLSRPCVGTDGTNLLVAYTENDGDLFVEVRDPSTLAVSTTYTASGAPLGHHMFVGKGSFDFGADRIVLAVGSTVHVYSISGTTLTEETAETFTLPASAASGGVAWNGSHFHSTHGAPLMYKYPDYYPGASENAYVSYRDTDGTDHTMDSPHASVAMTKRRYVLATLPPAPSGAATPAVYAAFATSDPADTALLLRSETPTGRTILIDPSVAGGTDLDPDSNTFGTGTPAWVKSQAGGLELYGDGQVKIAGYEVTDAWESYTPSWTAATTNPVLNDGTLDGYYKRIGNTVHFRIELTAGSTTTFGTGSWSLSLPFAPTTSFRFLVQGTARDVSAPATFWAGGDYNGSSTILLRLLPTSLGGALPGVNNTAPFAWANGDTLVLTGTYEAAP